MDPRVQSTLENLEANRYRGFCLADLARRVGLSSSRLEHLFKEQTGKSIRAFVQSKRLLIAQQLLVSTEDSVSEIMWTAGFTDLSNFDHAFRHAFGVSPAKYRRATTGAQSIEAKDGASAEQQVIPTL